MAMTSQMRWQSLEGACTPLHRPLHHCTASARSEDSPHTWMMSEMHVTGEQGAEGPTESQALDLLATQESHSANTHS